MDKERQSSLIGNLTCFAAYAIFGFNIISSKSIALSLMGVLILIYNCVSLRPVVVCMYTYVQPVIAMLIALALGLDRLTALKVAATLLVFIGVGLVNFVPGRGRAS